MKKRTLKNFKITVTQLKTYKEVRTTMMLAENEAEVEKRITAMSEGAGANYNYNNGDDRSTLISLEEEMEINEIK